MIKLIGQLGRCLYPSYIGSVREAIRRKNLLLFGIFPNGLDPPSPPVFLERFEELFKTLFYMN